MTLIIRSAIGGLLFSLALQAASPTSPSQQPAKSATGTLKEAAAAEDQAEELFKVGKARDAVPLAERAVRIRQRLTGESLLTAESQMTLGDALRGIEDFPEAAAAYQRAKSILERRLPPTDPRISEVVQLLAATYRSLGRFKDLEPLLVQALSIEEQRRPQKRGALAGAHNNLGMFLKTRGDLKAARGHLETALDLAEKSNIAPVDLAAIVTNLGDVELDQGDPQSAEKLFQYALSIHEKGKETYRLGQTLNSLGAALQEQGLLDKAEPVFTQALGVYERTRGRASPDYGQTLNNLAVLYLLKGDFDRAGPLYRQALDIREKALGPFHPDVGRSLAAYAVFLARTGRTSEAIAAQARHIDIIEHNLAEELETGSEAQKALSLASLSDSIEITLSLRNALGATEQDAQRLALLTVMRRKGRLLDMLAKTSGALRHSFTGADRRQFDHLSQLKADLARVFLQAPGQITASSSQQKIQQLNDQIGALESTLLGRPLDAAPDAITIAAVQSAIPRDAVLIDFFRYRSFDPDQSVAARRFGAPRYVAYALRHEGAPEWIELGESSSIDSKVAAFHRALTRTGDGSVSEAAAALRERLTNPLLRLAGNAREIIVSPEGELNLIPFAALTDGSGDYLVRRFLFTYVTSASELVRRPAAARSAAAPIIIANPAYGRSPSMDTGLGTFEQLPGAEQEAADIKKLLPRARVIVGASASEHFLKNVHAPRVLHIATHAYFFESGLATLDGGTRAARPKDRQGDSVDSVPPMVRTGLALAWANRGRVGLDGEDGILTAIEAASLDLDGTDLVFLSACDTGRGVIVPGDSIYGLRRAFMIAGARTQIVTLWQIDDEATRGFVDRFYRHLLNGEERSDALRAAQLGMLEQSQTADPFFWAPFLVSGENGRIDLTAWSATPGGGR